MNFINKEIELKKLYKKSRTVLYTGGTGSGKTFKAVTESDRFIIAVPTRQLAYEVFMDYKSIKTIETGEVHINNGGNAVVVFENLSGFQTDEYDTLIVDECHFINDPQRGLMLLNNIIEFKNSGKEVILLTATDTLSEEVKELLQIEEIKLTPFKTVSKKEVSVDEINRLKSEGEINTILVFTKYAPDEDTVFDWCLRLGIDKDKADFISANVPTSKRLETQIKFRNGELELVVSSNVLAQGVNFPADAVIVVYNEWDDWEIVQQKIGRAGRPQYTDKAYYALFESPEKEKKDFVKKTTTAVVKKFRGVEVEKLNFSDFEVPKGKSYRDYKYSKRFLKWLIESRKAKKWEKKAFRKLLRDEAKVRQILLSR